MMDVDLELEYSDPISKFLRSKLSEAKWETQGLRTCLTHRQEATANYLQELTRNNTNNSVTISEVSKKICNGKYVLGMEITNSGASPIGEVSLMLIWTSPTPLNYKFHLLCQHKPTPNLAQSGQIIITLPLPFFTDSLSYTLSGVLNFQQDDKRAALKIPSILLNPQDVTDDSFKTQLPRDLLSIIHTMERYEFVMVLPKNMTGLLDTLLIVDLGMNRMDVTYGKFYLVERTSEELDGTIVEVAGTDFSPEVPFKIYYKDRERLMGVVHYLHRKIPGVVVVPQARYQPDLSASDLADLLRESLRKELGTTGDVSQEFETDCIVGRIKRVVH